MVKQSEGSMRKHYLMLISCFDALRIHDTPAWRSKVFHAALPCTMDIIGEREERVARACHALQQLRVLFSFLHA